MSLFTERFNELRKASGKTQAQVASDLAMTPQAISYIAKGREPDFDVLGKIARYFDVTTDYLIGKSPYQNADDRTAVEKQAGSIPHLLSSLPPEVRGAFLPTLESLLQVLCGGEDISASHVILVRLANIMLHLTGIGVAYEERHQDCTEFAASDNATLWYAYANRIPHDSFKATLIKACDAARGELNELSVTLTNLFEQEVSQEVTDTFYHLGKQYPFNELFEAVTNSLECSDVQAKIDNATEEYHKMKSESPDTEKSSGHQTLSTFQTYMSTHSHKEETILIILSDGIIIPFTVPVMPFLSKEVLTKLITQTLIKQSGSSEVEDKTE